MRTALQHDDLRGPRLYRRPVRCDRQTLISIGIGLPNFIRGMRDTVKAKLRITARTELRLGDVLLTNDAYITGSHLNHITFIVLSSMRRTSWWRSHRLHGALAGHRRHACRNDHGHLLGRPAGPDLKIFSEGQAEPGDHHHHQGQRAHFPTRHGRLLRTDRYGARPESGAFLTILRNTDASRCCGAIAPIMDHSEAQARSRSSIPDGVYEAEVVHG